MAVHGLVSLSGEILRYTQTVETIGKPGLHFDEHPELLRSLLELII